MAWVNDPSSPGAYKYVPDTPAVPASPGIVSNATQVASEENTSAAPTPPMQVSNNWYTELGKVGDQPGIDYWNEQIKKQGYDTARAGFMASAKDNISKGLAVGTGDIPKVTAPVTTTPVTTPTTQQSTSQYQVNGETINSPTYNQGYNPAYDYTGQQYSSNSSTKTPNQAVAEYAAANQALKRDDPNRYNLEMSRVYEAAQMAAMTPQERHDWEINQGQPSEKYISVNGQFVANPNYNPFFETRYNSDPTIAGKYQEGYTYNPDGTIKSTSGAMGTPGYNQNAAPTNPYMPATSGGGSGTGSGGIVSNANAAASGGVNAPATPATAGAGVGGAYGYNPAQLGAATQWNVTAPQTVAGQIQNLIDPNSALGQQAVAQGKILANDRGLLNSTIAQTGAQSELNKLALGIANADAATQAKAAGYNADMSNQFTAANTTAQNQAGQFNAGAANNLQLGQLQSQTTLANTQLNNASAQATAQLQAKTQELVAKLQAGTQLSLADKESLTKLQLADMDAKTRVNLANIDAKTRADLGAVEANYKNILQTNQSAANLYQQATQNIAQIQLSKDMDAAAKDAAIKNQQTVLSDGLKILGGISGLNLGDLVIAPTTTTGITTSAGAATTATPTANAYVAAVTEGH